MNDYLKQFGISLMRHIIAKSIKLHLIINEKDKK